MPLIRACFVGLLGVMGCHDTPPRVVVDMRTAIDAAPTDGAVIEAMPADMRAEDAAPTDAGDLDAWAIDIGHAMPAVDAAVDAMWPNVIDQAVLDAVAVDATAIDAQACAAEACNDVDDDCDGLIDEGEACVAAVIAGCRVHVSLDTPDDRNAGIDSGGDGAFHGFGPPDDVDADDRLSIVWRCEPALLWAQRTCVITVAHADGSEADPVDCATSRCAQTEGDGAPVSLQFSADVDGDDRFAIGFGCADPQRPDRAAAVQARVQVWFATQHRRVANDGRCLDEPRHVRVPQWGFCPGLGVDDEGRHRCAGSAGDGALHMFSVGTLGGIWPDLGPCDTFGVAVTR